MDDHQERTLTCALAYAEKGWQVFPCHSIINGQCTCGKPKCSSPGKHPHTLAPNGSKDATSDEATIRKWFSKPNLNIAVVAGAASGLVLLDIDPGHGGGDSIEQFNVPRTPTVRTGGDGVHYYFQHPPNVEIRNSAGSLGPGLDVRGYHGYVIAPPSRHLSGNEYRWTLDPTTVPLALCPKWVYSEGTSGRTSTALISADEKIYENHRNSRMVSMGGAMRRQGMTRDEIYTALVMINDARCVPPLDCEELGTIADSLGGYEPRQILDIRPVLTCLADVIPKEVEWIWHNRIPVGKLTLFAGNPNVGKSFVTLHIAAAISQGGRWPDDDRPPEQGSVVVLASEDDLEDTVRPRLSSMGAAVANVHAMEAVAYKDNKGKSWESQFSLAKHLQSFDVMHQMLPDLRAIIIDPITAYLGKVDSHKNAEVRGALEPLVRWAAKHRVAIIGITHLNKNESGSAIYRVLGSMGFTAAARLVWGFAWEDPDKEDGPRLMVPVKANICVAPTALKFDIKDRQVVWDEGGPFPMSAAQGMGNGEKKTDLKGVEDAKEWITEELKWSDIASKRFLQMASKEHITIGIFKRAKAALPDVYSYKQGDTWFTGLRSRKDE